MRRKMPISSSIHSSMHIFPSSYWGMLRLEVEVLRLWWNGLIITLMFIIKFHRKFICLLTALIGKVFFKQKNTKQSLSLLIKTITLWNRINLLADMRFKLKMRESFKLLGESSAQKDATWKESWKIQLLAIMKIRIIPMIMLINSWSLGSEVKDQDTKKVLNSKKAMKASICVLVQRMRSFIIALAVE